MLVYTPPRPADHIPIISLTGSFSEKFEERKRVAWEIHKAARDTGFFYISDHGIPGEILERQLQAAKKVFSLPLAEKNAIDISLSNCMRGYEGMALQRLDAGSPPDLKESFMMGHHLEPSHDLVRRGVPNHGPNQWPASSPKFKHITEDYHDRMVALGQHLMRCIALSLELPEDQFDDGTKDPMCSVRMLHYPPHPADSEFNQLGAGAHTDWGSVTMLLQDNVGGLEVRNAAGEWLLAKPISGTLVVNLGDMMHRWTNGLYKSTMHRVLNNISATDRYSVASFFNPQHFYTVECLPTCLPDHGDPLFPPCTVGEHITNMFQKTYATGSSVQSSEVKSAAVS